MSRPRPRRQPVAAEHRDPDVSLTPAEVIAELEELPTELAEPTIDVWTYGWRDPGALIEGESVCAEPFARARLHAHRTHAFALTAWLHSRRLSARQAGQVRKALGLPLVTSWPLT